MCHQGKHLSHSHLSTRIIISCVLLPHLVPKYRLFIIYFPLSASSPSFPLLLPLENYQIYTLFSSPSLTHILVSPGGWKRPSSRGRSSSSVFVSAHQPRPNQRIIGTNRPEPEPLVHTHTQHCRFYFPAKHYTTGLFAAIVSITAQSVCGIRYLVPDTLPRG